MTHDDSLDRSRVEATGRPVPSGLAGWLILVGLGLIISPISLTKDLLNTFPGIFSNGTWQALTTPGRETYLPYWAHLILAELVLNCLFIVASLVLLFLYVRQSWRFPKLYIYYLIANVAFILGDALAGHTFLSGRGDVDPDTVRALAGALVNAAIWIPYMLVSKRVRNTFVAA